MVTRSFWDCKVAAKARTTINSFIIITWRNIQVRRMTVVVMALRFSVPPFGETSVSDKKRPELAEKWHFQLESLSCLGRASIDRECRRAREIRGW